jgi:hypothetical protein
MSRNRAPNTAAPDPFDQALDSHFAALLEGTQRYFEKIGIEINTAQLQQMMRQPAGEINFPVIPQADPVRPLARPATVLGPARRSRPEMQVFGPYAMPMLDIPLARHRLRLRPPVQPTLFDVPLFGFPQPPGSNYAEGYSDTAHDYSIDQLCTVFEGGAEYEAADDCNICMEELGIMSDQNLHVELLCKHRYHRNCIAKWMSEQRTCPLCRDAIEIKV